jgi:hypothetical chaperone protein
VHVRTRGIAQHWNVVFEYEPVGAAARYATRLDHDELLAVADFGGGTSDFTLVRVGSRRGEVLATGGIGVSDDAFDARVIDALMVRARGVRRGRANVRTNSEERRRVAA